LPNGIGVVVAVVDVVAVGSGIVVKALVIQQQKILLVLGPRHTQYF